MSDRLRITRDDLDGDQVQLADLIGLDNYIKLVENFGGSAIYIRKMDSLLQGERNRQIYEKFDGYNFRDLAIEFNLSERAVREIVSPHMQEVRSRPIHNQISFEDLR